VYKRQMSKRTFQQCRSGLGFGGAGDRAASDYQSRRQVDELSRGPLTTRDRLAPLPNCEDARSARMMWAWPLVGVGALLVVGAVLVETDKRGPGPVIPSAASDSAGPPLPAETNAPGLPDMTGRNAETARQALVGLTGMRVELASVDPRHPNVRVARNWTVVAVEQPTPQSVTLKVRKT